MILFTGGGCLLPGGSGPGGVPAPRGVPDPGGGVPAPGGCSRLTPKGEIEGDQVQAHTQGGH